MNKVTEEFRMDSEKSEKQMAFDMKNKKYFVERFDNIPYGNDLEWNLLDIYKPSRRTEELLPVIINVHGGGWVANKKEAYQWYGMELAERGFGVVNFSYRLAPETKFPGQIEDMNQAVLWTLEHGKEYGLDTEKIFMAGDSAGAHLLSLYICMLTNQEYAESYTIKFPKDFLPLALSLNCGAYDMEKNIDPMMPGLMESLLPEGGTAEELRMLTPLHFITDKYPPVYLLTSNEDFLQAQTPVFAGALHEKNVPYISRFFGGREVHLGHVFHTNPLIFEAGRCNDEECAFFRSFL